MATRRSLLSRIKDCSNQDSWREFYNLYSQLIYSVARKAGLKEPEAQDVVQETFVHISKSIPKFQYDPATGSFKSWLLHTTRWHIASQFRRRPHACEPLYDDSNGDRRTSTAEQIPDPDGDALERTYEEDWKRSIQAAALKRVKERANPRQYQAFHLYAVEGMPINEITRLLGVTRNQVYLAKMRIQRLAAAEAKRLEREGL